MFQRGHQITPDLKVQFHLKSGANADTYRVVDGQGAMRFLKVFHRERLDEGDLRDGQRIREIELLSRVTHPAITRYEGSGTLETTEGTKEYLLTGFISGETVQDRLRRDLVLDPVEARRVVLGVLEALAYLHGLEDPVIHNEVTNQNVMLDLSGALPEPRLIDFGHARRGSEGEWRPRMGQDPYFLAPECYEGRGGTASDVFSVGALYYNMLFGILPWYINISQFQAQHSDVHTELAKERNRPLKYPRLQSGLEVPSGDLAVLKQALSLDPDKRFPDAAAMREALLAGASGKGKEAKPAAGQSKAGPREVAPKLTRKPIKRGFDAVAGMEGLKELLMRDVVMALKEREGYEAYGIPIPNGMLLYGPPGCGKTYLAKRFAEEVGIGFHAVKPSDLASIYVHGTQEKIGALFKEAREQAPTILFFDEIDALMPSRDGQLGHSYSSEVNEFLVQMGDCSKDGVFMIAATNRPDLIDSAVLRTGRMDKVIYVPPPDMEARQAMFQLHLEGRPVAGDIDATALAAATEGRVA
ncbi:MAG: AAA family ATPase, partial [Flavobacteriales bacterium]|nr:AAA family ATPase [Flavobacteriales bacterium]